jgi:hypothetical protein
MSNRDHLTATETPPATALVESADPGHWPPEARLILSALEAGEATPGENRRGGSRTLYQVRASLRLFSDSDGSPPWRLYTRDVTARSVGFITPHRLPLGYGGVVELTDPHGHSIRAHCTLFRCRQTAGGWFEGALSFHRPQWSLRAEQSGEQEDDD